MPFIIRTRKLMRSPLSIICCGVVMTWTRSTWLIIYLFGYQFTCAHVRRTADNLGCRRRLMLRFDVSDGSTLIIILSTVVVKGEVCGHLIAEKDREIQLCGFRNGARENYWVGVCYLHLHLWYCLDRFYFVVVH